MPLGIVGKAAVDVAKNAAAPIIGMGINSMFHKQQLKHQQDFIDQQSAANREQANYTQQLGLDMWNKTNYEAQRKHMEAAGLNVGLMYGGAGASGTTGSASAGSVQGGQAPNATAATGMGLQTIAQTKLLEAQAENLKANTAKTIKETEKTGVEIPKVQADTTNTETDTELKKSQIKINEYNQTLSRVESEIAEANKSNNIGMLNQAYKKLIADTNLTETQTQEAQKRMINLGVQNALMNSNILKNKSDIELNKSKINQIANDITIAWEQLGVNKVNADTNQQAIIQQGTKIFQDRLASEFNMDAEVGRQISQIGSMLLGGMILNYGKSIPQIQEKYITIDKK